MNSKSVIKVQHVEVFEDYWRKHKLIYWWRGNGHWAVLVGLIILTLALGFVLYLKAPANAQYIRDNASAELQEIIKGGN